MSTVNTSERQSLYAEVTSRIVAELEAGRLPWAQPWDASCCPCTLPDNAGSGRTYSGINVLILWTSAIEQGFSSQRWLTYRQAEAAGGHVRRGEKGTVACYADRFTPREEAAKVRDEDREARTVAFLKRFTVFNLDQCEGLTPEAIAGQIRHATAKATEVERQHFGAARIDLDRTVLTINDIVLRDDLDEKARQSR